MTAMSSLILKSNQASRDAMRAAPIATFRDTLTLCYRKFFTIEAMSRSESHAALASALRDEYITQLMPFVVSSKGDVTSKDNPSVRGWHRPAVMIL